MKLLKRLAEYQTPGEMLFIEDYNDFCTVVRFNAALGDWEEMMSICDLSDNFDNTIEIGDVDNGDPLITCYIDFPKELRRYYA